MLTVTAYAAIFHLDGPVAIFVDVVGWFAEAGHGLDADGVAFDELVAATFLAVVRDFGGFVHRFTNAVADVVFDYTEVALTEYLLDGVADVADMGARLYLLNSLPHGGFGDFNHFFDGRVTFATNQHGEGGVGKIALVLDVEVKGNVVTFLKRLVGGGAVD